jgi:heme-degrading monooxygenase HmoA
MSSASQPSPPYFAVIFVSKRTEGDAGYGSASDRMAELGAEQPGFLGIESVRAPDGRGITVVFYDSKEAIHNWGRNSEHREVQALGRRQWYEEYAIYYAQVEEARRWKRVGAPPSERPVG